MPKLQYIFLTTTVAFLGSNIPSFHANASIDKKQTIHFANRDRSAVRRSSSINLLAQKDGSKQQPQSDDEMLELLQKRQEKVDKGLNKIRRLTGTESQEEAKDETPTTEDITEEETTISNQLVFRMLAIGLPACILLILLLKPVAKGISEIIKTNYQEKYGKPPVPEGSVKLHERSLLDAVATTGGTPATRCIAQRNYSNWQ